MRNGTKSGCILALLLTAALSLTQDGEQFHTLLVNEQSGKVALLQIDDKTYIDLRRFVQIAKATLSFEGNRILVDLPCTLSHVPEKPGEPEQATNTTLSREFMKAGIEEIALMREWASTLANAIQNGYPVADNWVAGYRAKAQSGLGVASTAVSTDSDRNGLQLLNHEFNSVQEWSNMLLEARKSLDTAKYAVSPDALRSDPLSQNIVSCARFLGQMLASGKYQDDPSCH